MSNNRKFTLIELLVAIAIIGILASLLLPTLSKARKTSLTAVCNNQMRQIIIAEHMYTSDNNGEFVSVRDDSGTGVWDMYLAQNYMNAPISDAVHKPVNINITEASHPAVYNAMEKIILCPNDTKWKSSIAGTLRRTYAKSMRTSGVRFIHAGEIKTFYPNLNITSIERPSEIFQFIEQQHSTNILAKVSHAGYLDSARYQLMANALPKLTYHKNSHYNYAFVDGSVRLIDVNSAASGDHWRP
ncbi:type II secretion system protein [Lentisphaera profundi]|uniref:Type II secretion system protein n=1 Tax=Lentisphaera profundi TaxID=1658616 RepID=A0ABY7VS45_9BACT|nr:type II secretion system protein [Lentisphaera profundi]WDE96559.1 type II secretion system protein [Lentisphaera profundi]